MRAARAAAQGKSDPRELVYLTHVDRTFLGIRLDGEKDEHPHINLKYYHPDHQCFSSWEEGDLKAFSDLNRKMGSMSWVQIVSSGGKLGMKTGLGYTPHKDRAKLPKKPDLSEISPDISFFEMRVSKEARVHGFRVKDAFFLVWLDKDHEVYKE